MRSQTIARSSFRKLFYRQSRTTYMPRHQLPIRPLQFRVRLSMTAFVVGLLVQLVTDRNTPTLTATASMNGSPRRFRLDSCQTLRGGYRHGQTKHMEDHTRLCPCLRRMRYPTHGRFRGHRIEGGQARRWPGPTMPQLRQCPSQCRSLARRGPSPLPLVSVQCPTIARRPLKTSNRHDCLCEIRYLDLRALGERQ